MCHPLILISVGVHPITGTSVMRYSIAYRILIYSDNPTGFHLTFRPAYGIMY